MTPEVAARDNAAVQNQKSNFGGRTKKQEAKADLRKRVMMAMGDGRWRTSNDIALRLDIRQDAASHVLTRLKREGRLIVEEVGTECTRVFCKAPDDYTPPPQKAKVAGKGLEKRYALLKAFDAFDCNEGLTLKTASALIGGTVETYRRVAAAMAQHDLLRREKHNDGFRYWISDQGRQALAEFEGKA